MEETENCCRRKRILEKKKFVDKDNQDTGKDIPENDVHDFESPRLINGFFIHYLLVFLLGWINSFLHQIIEGLKREGGGEREREREGEGGRETKEKKNKQKNSPFF